VGLRSHKIWAAGCLNKFHKRAIWRCTADAEAAFFDVLTKRLIHFVAMAVTLDNIRRTVSFGYLAACL
jgi:hypothetical protein